ncbi:MAG: hypothetical protein ABEJ70_00825 [Halobacteriaceae archaeon]
MDDESVDERLRAVERTLTDGRPVADLADEAALQDRLDAMADRLDAVEAAVDDLEGATQALRGYVGNVRAVNRDVERRADAAFAAAGADRRRDAHATGATTPASDDGGPVDAGRDGDGRDFPPEAGAGDAHAGRATRDPGRASDRRDAPARTEGSDSGPWPSAGAPSPGAAADADGGAAGYPNPVPDPPARETRSLRERVADWL